ncbi:hypothetical protein [Thermococcus camini]|uniref:Uncharacterized protein n=1 Tax=Thermococcus camini TaxID=2016373 RepID=A0A7G2DC55_9EURY|nr:hypothetical protein [Thermococcus camini]CAD5244550.1 conserved protein of unknown function [Thermococcus camini]
MVFDRRKKLKFIGGIHHGSHLDTVCSSQKKGLELIEDAILGKYPSRSVKFEKKKLLGKEKLSYEIVDVPLANGLSLRVVKREEEPVTAFPVLEGIETKFEIEEVLEWKKWPEANISGAVLNEYAPGVVFYATDYIERKETYLNSEKLNVRLAFLVYTGTTEELRRETTNLPDGGEVVIDLNEAEILLPATVSVGNAFIDDYVMTAHVLEVDEVSTPCGSGYLMLLSNEPIGKVRAFALKENLSGEIEKGASLKLAGWLQGKL